MTDHTRRPLGGVEKLYYALDHIASKDFALVAGSDKKIPEDKMPEALVLLTDLHPQLNYRIVVDDREQLWFSGEQHDPVQYQFLQIADDQDWIPFVERTITECIDPYRAPLFRIILLQKRESSVLVALFNHSIADGLSGLIVLQDLLKIISGERPAPLPVPLSMDEALQLVPKCPDPVFHAGKTSVISGIRTKQSPVKVSKIRFNAELTSKLISRSKTEGTTVTGILYAALAFAMKGTDGRFSNRKIATRVPVSVRNELKSGRNVVLNVITKTMELDTCSHGNVWDLARQVSTELGEVNTVGQISGYVGHFRKEMLRDAAFPEIVAKMRETIGTDLMLSNLGNLPDHTYSDLKILELWGPLVISGTGTEQTIGAVTIRGELTLTQVSSAPIPALLEETMKLLIATL